MIGEMCIDVIESFKVLQKSLATIHEHVCGLDQHLPAWFQAPLKLPMPTNSSMRQQACALLKQLEYLDSQQPREILVGAGIIAASNETILALEQLNAAKLTFKQAVLKLKAAKVAPSYELLATQFEQLLPQRELHVANNLARLGLARVHLKQCYRKVPYFLERPLKISWTWANTRSIIKIDVQQAEQRLKKHAQDAGVERQLRLLQGLAPNEKLAIIQDLAPHLRANLVLPDGHEQKRVMVKGPVPIFYLSDGKQELPSFIPPRAKRGRDKERLVRNDVKINPTPFLPAIRAHRYFECEVD